MNKKFLSAIVLIVTAATLLVGFAACQAQFKLDFVVDGEIYHTIDTGGEEAVTLPDDPTKDGYVFDGWYWDKDIWSRPFTAESLLTVKLTGNMTVYAKWINEDVTKRDYKVVFDTMGYGEVETQSVPYGTLAVKPVAPERPGYALVGWYREADLTTVWNFRADTVTEDVTLYAKWVPSSDAAGCAIIDSGEMTMDGKTLTIELPNAQTTFAFGEQLTVSPYAQYEVSTDIAGKDVIPSATVELEVGDNVFYIQTVSGTGSNRDQYKAVVRRREVYTVTYSFGGGIADVTEQVEEDALAPFKDASRDGYTFTGWSSNGEAWDFESDRVTGDVTLTAGWSVNAYNIEYKNMDGAVNAASNPTSYTVLTLGGADGSVALADPSKVGEILYYTSNGDGSFEVTQEAYTFLGWYKDAEFGQQVTSLTLDLGDATLYAKWSDQPTTVQKETVQVYTREGDYIYFGEYPQTIKSADVTVGDVADGDGYYLGSDGARYAKVAAYPYGSDYTFSDGSAVTRGNTYYFKVEPIRWRILSEDGGSAFILADGIVANHYYHHTSFDTTIEGETVYANNYKHSDIRAWLNGEFLNAAFGEIAQSLIKTTEVDNSVYSTGYSPNKYACENTFDKVFLLSYREVTDSAYGFESSSRTYDTARRMTVSDYARSTGARMDTSSDYFGCGYWWLRSPYYYDSNDARGIYYYGNADGNYANGYADIYYRVDYDYHGVVPALNITL